MHIIKIYNMYKNRTRYQGRKEIEKKRENGKTFSTKLKSYEEIPLKMIQRGKMVGQDRSVSGMLYLEIEDEKKERWRKRVRVGIGNMGNAK